jgi:DNA-binding LacI/PurR family transcriptional regulator
LAELGHKRIAVITEQVQSSADRIRGYKTALNDFELLYDDNLFSEAQATVENGEKEAGKLLNLEDPPTAIFAFNDILAIGAMEAVHKRGLSIPEDVSIIGFDNTILAKHCYPPLTTMAQPLDEIGNQAVDLLVGEIESKITRKQRVMLSAELVIRDSTGPLKKKKKTNASDVSIQ